MNPQGVTRVERERTLESVRAFVESINMKEKMGLSHIRTVRYHMDKFREEVLNIGAVRDGHSREAVRRTLKDIREKAEQLDKLAAQKELQGQKDDGGDVFPSERGNICFSIDRVEVDKNFHEQVKALCKALDAVRSAVLANGNVQAAVLNVNGRLTNVRTLKEYDAPGMAYGIAFVLGEEFRWVTKHYVRRQAAPQEAAGGATASPEALATLVQSLERWMSDAEPSCYLDPKVRETRYNDALQQTARIDPESQRSLAQVRTSLQTLEMCKEMVSEFITCSEPDFRERIRAFFSDIRTKSDALKRQAEQREAAGEVDEVNEFPASQRDNVCKKIDEYGLDPEWHLALKRVCDAFDRLRTTALNGGDSDSVMMDIMGNMGALKARPGYAELPINGQVENVFTEEYRWLVSFKASRGL